MADGVPVSVRYSGPRACEAPLAREALGPFERRERDVPTVADVWTWAGGVTVADLDEDGWLDTLLPVEPGLALYPGSADGAFEALGAEVFGDFELDFASGTSVADYDGDGDLDIYVTRVRGEPIPEDQRTDGQGRNVLLRNEGRGAHFTDVTDEAGVDGCGVHHRTGEQTCFRSMTSSWGDMDADGDLDLFVGNYGWVDERDGTAQEDMGPAEPSFLYRNEGDGTFTDLSDQLPDTLQDGYTYAGGFVDLDGDGDLDLYTVNDFGRVAPNRVLWNDGGAWSSDGVPASGLEVPVTGMGLGLADFNADGWMDVVIPEWAGNVLLLSDGAGRWIDSADASGLAADVEAQQVVGWGAQTGDVDNDGDTDVLVQFGFLPNANPQVWSNPQRQPDAMYRNESVRGSGGRVQVAFREVARNWGMADVLSTRGAVFADLNRDGWLDVAKRSLGIGNYAGPAVVYLSRCGEARSLTVRLRQPGTLNTHAIGSKVTVRTRGLPPQTRQLLAGGTGFASTPPPELHFGLGGMGLAERVEVTWPDGARSFVDYVPAMQEITIFRER